MGIALKQLSYTYQEGTPFEGAALFDVNIEIPSGSYTALIGHTGSGKSTIKWFAFAQSRGSANE